MECYRSGATFDVSALRSFFDGPYGALKRAVFEELSREPLFNSGADIRSRSELSTEQQRHLLWQRLQRAIQLGISRENPRLKAVSDLENSALGRAIFSALRTATPMFPLSFGLNFMFASVCDSLGTKEQHEQFTWHHPDMTSLKVFGCFALTELAHGTNAQGILTEAVYDANRRIYVLHTPRNERGTPIGAKWWVGNAGKHATHAVVAAQLKLNGGALNKGLHFFVVQLRDTTTLLPLPGVTVGDIGRKPGWWNEIDNGFMVFDHCVLPKSALLNRYQDVTDSGEYVCHLDPAKRFSVSLGALSAGRINITVMSGETVREALLIAVRYSAARRQFGPPTRPDEEDPVLEYPLQQARILPFLAGAYAMKFFGDWLSDAFFAYQKRSALREESEEFLDLNAEIHALSCGTKPFSSWYAYRAVGECRLACGGHGFITVGGLTELRDFADPFQTFEGDNNVLLQQLERWLLRPNVSSPLQTIRTLQRGRALLGQKWSLKHVDDVSNIQLLQQALDVRVAHWAAEAEATLTEKMAAFTPASGEFKDYMWRSWNESQPGAMQSAAKAFTESVVFEKSAERVLSAPPHLRPVLLDLQVLFGLQLLLDSGGVVPLLESAFVSAEQSRLLRTAFTLYCGRVKVNAVALVDVYAQPDNFIGSVLGKSDGRVYDHLWNAVLADPSSTQRAAYWKDARQPKKLGEAGDLIANAMNKSKL